MSDEKREAREAHWLEFTPIARPKGMRKLSDKACYRNALKVALDGDYAYAEGLAWASEAWGPIHHAWVVDADGHAIDPTWREPGIRYYGVAFEWADLDHDKLGGPQLR
jgi:hypothetical protein